MNVRGAKPWPRGGCYGWHRDWSKQVEFIKRTQQVGVASRRRARRAEEGHLEREEGGRWKKQQALVKIDSAAACACSVGRRRMWAAQQRAMRYVWGNATPRGAKEGAGNRDPPAL